MAMTLFGLIVRSVAAGAWKVERLVADVEALTVRGLPREQYFREVSARLRRVLHCDAACWHTIDPQLQLMTSDAPEELIETGVFTAESAPAAGAAVVASEYLLDDVNTFAGLARRRSPVGILSHATKGNPQRSRRYREVLAVAGIPFELRAAFVTRGRLWGAVHLARRDAGHDFTNQDARALGAITSAVADGIRTSLRLDAARRGDPGGPGLVVLDRSDGVELITPPARPLIDALRAPGLRGDGEVPPTPLLALASHARRYSAGTCAGNAIAVPTRAGWLTLHASLPDGIADGRVAIVLEHAATPLATAVRLEAHGVTSREREVAFLLAKGMSNPEIAETLVLSPYTVQDHVKNLFEKTDVSSRQELIARIFLDDYLPQLTARTPLTTTASFARQGI